VNKEQLKILFPLLKTTHIEGLDACKIKLI